MAPANQNISCEQAKLPDVVIENPVINSPFEEPRRHFLFGDDGITNEIVGGRRPSAYFVPIAAPRKKGKQLAFDTQWTKDRLKESDEVNRIRGRVGAWRTGGYAGVTRTTLDLLRYWTDPEREKPIFFCQLEAAETAIYLTEAAAKSGDNWIENWLRRANQEANPLLYRMSFKMATGAGKTVVMAMLIAWHALNKLANPQDPRFSDSFLVVTPGITIRDRLRVLLPNDPNNFYRQRDVLPSVWLEQLGQARIVITNFHAFKQREKGDAARLTKQILTRGNPNGAFTETPAEMVRRVCRELGNKKNVVVINDEAHHCYRRRAEDADEALTGEDRREAQKRNEEARVWISGLEAVKAKLGVRALYDLSATPFFLRGSGYSEGTLFPWVVSDFSLIDAIEAGIVKVPRVPVSDDTMTGDMPTYRNLWLRIRDDLPRKGRKTEAVTGEPALPVELEGALRALYSNYEKAYQRWETNAEARASGLTPPVFIVVCNNTNVSKLVFDWVGGWKKPLPEGSEVLVPGVLPIFSNVKDAAWTARPNTILVDSTQLESGDAMSADFKKIAAAEIEEFKSDIRKRFPGRDVEDLTDEDLLREVMNTVGKQGKLGENVKCVVSVSMLTEGWDANTVTHILGVRAFQTQLLCEQVVGRGLRRMSYATEKRIVHANGAAVEIDAFSPEYAEVFGVPFSFIPAAGHQADPKPGPMPTRVRALEERIEYEVTFPRLVGYRYELSDPRLAAKFTEESVLALSTADVPTKTENAPIVGETTIMTLDDLKRRREQEVAFLLAKLTLEKYFRDDGGALKPWLFPQVLDISRRWLSQCVVLKDGTFPQLLLLIEFAHGAADRIYRSIVRGAEGTRALKPVLRPYDGLGSTRYVDFDTTRNVYPTQAKCHISHVVCDTRDWEQKAAQAIEEMPEVLRYVKNHGLGFTIPYTFEGRESQYVPDYVIELDDGHGGDDPLHLIVEITGEPKKDKAAKVATARTFWVPSVNAHGGFGRWAFVEVTDPWDLQNTIRAKIEKK